MSDSENFDPLSPARPKNYDPQERKFPRGVVIRLIAYLVAGHVFAAFLYLLFAVAGKG
ncbi:MULTISPECIES: DUF6126 family protein [Streptomyces]|jgi:hypothetical protein|uniref:DUF6126 family protein n=1 Tax=unclassified Streptomyces TaxID=2593676 RepID=UPI000883CF65|nr:MULTISPECIES: DUF6126 family protein [unclassified Streptomyces]MDX2731336.1 DUF6126 family protein [Streptomyces sp. PA03-2a]MDX3768632.1 DUF6126 family protein [Streptomyces sp. AK08-01B]MDX3818566.1 DUF6126 family protein [Streptomyces sp. AK08-01A]SCX84226.1 hypothetical protein SAMN02745898_1015 [Streptomyces sp. 136MFCol5.1]SFS48161.1 hypothetical protein SAMN04487982_101847 [Streptomyces sp. ok210]